MTYSEGATLLCVAARFDFEDVIPELGRPVEAHAEGSGHTAHDGFLLGLRAEQGHFAGRNEHTMAFGTRKIFMPAHGSVVFPVLHTYACGHLDGNLPYRRADVRVCGSVMVGSSCQFS